jgi:dipeptidyl aminopeptidase/acylaminoacyl peptidase
VLDALGRRLLLAHDDGQMTGISVAYVERPHLPPEPLCRLAGSSQQVAWDEERGRVLVLVAEPGSDTGAVWSGRRHVREPADPEMNQGHTGAQQLWSVDITTGRPSMRGPVGGSIWEFALLQDGTLACIASEEAGEGGWYAPIVVRLDLDVGAKEVLYRPEQQVSHLAVDRTTDRIGFAEGWCSDRGLMGGEIVVLAKDGRLEQRVTEVPADVTWLEWDEQGRLFFAGWQDLSSVSGSLDPNGRLELLVEPAALVAMPPTPSFALAPKNALRLTTRSDEVTPPELVVYGDNGTKPWTWVTTRSDPPAESTVVEVAWQSFDGREIHGLLLVPSPDLVAKGNGGSLVIVIHGGPTWLYHHSFNPGRANRLLEAGFSVLLPNPRGSIGRGAEFVAANLGDPGGAELEDIFAGAAWAQSEGLVAPGKPAVMGASYGGYLSAVAATAHADRICSAVVISGIADLGSARNTGNNYRGYDLIFGGMPHQERVRQLCAERSPIYLASGRVAPTLILHGDEDRCVPVTQAHELYTCLSSVGAEVEMATYPREGHQILEAAHAEDLMARTLRWLSRHRAAS